MVFHQALTRMELLPAPTEVRGQQAASLADELLERGNVCFEGEGSRIHAEHLEVVHRFEPMGAVQRFSRKALLAEEG